MSYQTQDALLIELQIFLVKIICTHPTTLQHLLNSLLRSMLLIEF